MKRMLPSFTALVAALLLAACSTTGMVQKTDLMHHHWNLSAIDGVAVGPEIKSDLEIGENLSIHGLAGCNRFFGSATLQQGVLKAEPLASTQMACPPKLQKVERAVLETLTGGAKVDNQGQQLLLIGDQHRLTYQLSDYM